MTGFKTISPDALNESIFSLIAKDWALVAAGDSGNCNMLTANWLGMGYFWMKNVCFVYIRPSRYTYEFIEKNPTLSLSFLPSEYRDALKFCGANSGRDYDKFAETGLESISLPSGTVAVKQAKLIFECKKMAFWDTLPENFISEEIAKWYTDGDYHRLYACEILNVYTKEQ